MLSWSLLAGCDCAGREAKAQAFHLQDLKGGDGRAQPYLAPEHGATGRLSTGKVKCVTNQSVSRCPGLVARTNANRLDTTVTGTVPAPQTKVTSAARQLNIPRQLQLRDLKWGKAPAQKYRVLC